MKVGIMPTLIHEISFTTLNPYSAVIRGEIGSNDEQTICQTIMTLTPSKGQFHQHAYALLLSAQMLVWCSTSISPSKLRPLTSILN